MQAEGLNSWRYCKHGEVTGFIKVGRQCCLGSAASIACPTRRLSGHMCSHKLVQRAGPMCVTEYHVAAAMLILLRLAMTTVTACPLLHMQHGRSTAAEVAAGLKKTEEKEARVAERRQKLVKR